MDMSFYWIQEHYLQQNKLNIYWKKETINLDIIPQNIILQNITELYDPGMSATNSIFSDNNIYPTLPTTSELRGCVAPQMTS